MSTINFKKDDFLLRAARNAEAVILFPAINDIRCSLQPPESMSKRQEAHHAGCNREIEYKPHCREGAAEALFS
jgi:hypothetical protein